MLNYFGNALPLQDAGNTFLEVLLNEEMLRSGVIVFVCHSLGGLMVKQMLREANDQKSKSQKVSNFLKQVKGVVFAATPHFGSLHASLLDKLRLILWPSRATLALVKNDANLRNLNNWYRNWDPVLHEKSILNKVYYETCGTAAGTIVDAGSADGGLPGVTPLAISGKDHIDIVKPSDRADLIHKSVSSFITDVIGADTHSGEHSKTDWPSIDRIKTSILPYLARLVVLASLVGIGAWLWTSPEPTKNSINQNVSNGTGVIHTGKGDVNVGQPPKK